jgi:hypothetical protein
VPADQHGREHRRKHRTRRESGTECLERDADVGDGRVERQREQLLRSERGPRLGQRVGVLLGEGAGLCRQPRVLGEAAHGLGERALLHGRAETASHHSSDTRTRSISAEGRNVMCSTCACEVF